MTPEELKHGKELEERGTKGPWISNMDNNLVIENTEKTRQYLQTSLTQQTDYDGGTGMCRKDDADLIVWLRNHAKELIEMGEENGRLKEELIRVKSLTNWKEHDCGRDHPGSDVYHPQYD